MKLEHVIGVVLLQKPDVAAAAAAAADQPPMASVVAAAAVACTNHYVPSFICHESGNALHMFCMSYAQYFCYGSMVRNNVI